MFLRVAEQDGEKQSDEVKRNKLEENTDSKSTNCCFFCFIHLRCQCEKYPSISLKSHCLKKIYIIKTVLGTVRPRYPRNHSYFKVTLETMFIKKTFYILTLKFWILKLFSLSCWFWDDNVWLPVFFINIFCIVPDMVYNADDLPNLCIDITL